MSSQQKAVILDHDAIMEKVMEASRREAEAKARAEGAREAAPARLAESAAEAAAGQGFCSTEEKLAMKNSILSESIERKADGQGSTKHNSRELDHEGASPSYS